MGNSVYSISQIPFNYSSVILIHKKPKSYKVVKNLHTNTNNNLKQYILFAHENDKKYNYNII